LSLPKEGFHDDAEEAKWKAKAFRYLVFLSPLGRGTKLQIPPKAGVRGLHFASQACWPGIPFRVNPSDEPSSLTSLKIYFIKPSTTDFGVSSGIPIPELT
jgi:hypothetical protein